MLSFCTLVGFTVVLLRGASTCFSFSVQSWVCDSLRALLVLQECYFRIRYPRTSAPGVLPVLLGVLLWGLSGGLHTWVQGPEWYRVVALPHNWFFSALIWGCILKNQRWRNFGLVADASLRAVPGLTATGCPLHAETNLQHNPFPDILQPVLLRVCILESNKSAELFLRL